MMKSGGVAREEPIAVLRRKIQQHPGNGPDESAIIDPQTCDREIRRKHRALDPKNRDRLSHAFHLP
jgi:hypothetical protein